jgi:hypothetical protein
MQVAGGGDFCGSIGSVSARATRLCSVGSGAGIGRGEADRVDGLHWVRLGGLATMAALRGVREGDLMRGIAALACCLLRAAVPSIFTASAYE